MGVWGEHVVPRLADRSLRSPALDRLRREACAPLRGEVLEIGFGSGLNLACYPAPVTSVAAVEPSDVAWRISGPRREDSPVPVERRGLDGQQLAAPDASYDAVLTTFTLCTVPDPTRALAEARRVLRPGGVLCLLEHGLAPDPAVAAWQHRLEPLQRRLDGGCHLTRDVGALLAGSGLETTSLRSAYLPGPGVSRPWTYVSTATAVPRA